MLNDLDMSKGDKNCQQQQPMNMSKTRPNYNVNVSSFASKPNPSAQKSNVQVPKMKVTTNTFGDLLGKTQCARKFKKVQAPKKIVKSNKSILRKKFF